MPKGFAEDYIQVNERIIAFKEEFPEGSLQSEIISFTDSFVLVKAYAYRSAEDQRPGIGHSGLKIPGLTPYTRGSELENAETSAWGRALAALGFEVKRGIASREEVENKSEISITIEGSEVEGVARGGRTGKANDIQIKQISQLSRQLGLGPAGVRDLIADELNDAVLLPDNEGAAAKVLVAYLESLSSDDIATLIRALSAKVESVDDQS